MWFSTFAGLVSAISRSVIISQQLHVWTFCQIVLVSLTMLKMVAIEMNEIWLTNRKKENSYISTAPCNKINIG